MTTALKKQVFSPKGRRSLQHYLTILEAGRWIDKHKIYITNGKKRPRYPSIYDRIDTDTLIWLVKHAYRQAVKEHFHDEDRLKELNMAKDKALRILEYH